jgi:endonuclease/exonuclease/phosphatase family metal-dependent hydrolase
MWLSSLFRTPKSPSPVQKGRRSATFRPHVEPLEDRTVPATLSPADHLAGPPTEQAARAVTVMTRNLYVGADIAPLGGAIATGDPSAILGAVSTFWAGVLSTNFPQRAAALADEIADAQPLLIGLQEVSLFRTGAPDSFFGNPTRAEQVELDYLDILLGELGERGLHYAPVAVTQNVDAELTGFVAPGVLRDIRLTDRDVILARTDLPASQLRLSNVQTANFATNLTVPIGATGQLFTNLCGWGAIDVQVRGKPFRFINAHLQAESPNPLVNAIQVAQARELLTGPAGTPLPVVLVGDFNSRADGTGTATYGLLRGAGFDDAWSQTHPEEPGNTFGHDADLRNATVNFTQRLDLVLCRGDLRALDADVVGDELADRTPSGLWPSDHGGVVATLGAHVRPLPDPKKGSLRGDDPGRQHREHLIAVPAHEIGLQLGEDRGPVYGWEAWDRDQ